MVKEIKITQIWKVSPKILLKLKKDPVQIGKFGLTDSMSKPSVRLDCYILSRHHISVNVLFVFLY